MLYHTVSSDLVRPAAAAAAAVVTAVTRMARAAAASTHPITRLPVLRWHARP